MSRYASAHFSFVERIVVIVCYPFIALASLLGLYRWGDDPARALTGRAKVIWHEATARGIRMRQMILCGKPMEFYTVRMGKKNYYFNGLPIPPSRNALSYSWIDDKINLKRFFQKHQIPVSKGGRVWNLVGARKTFAALSKPVIVKPRRGSHGRHSVTHVYTEEELVEAHRIATQLCQCVVVEEHLIGSVYRGTYVDGTIVGILRGDPPRVVGDGVSTIRELVARKNATRHPRVGEVIIDAKCVDFLARQELSPDTVVDAGRVIDLSEKIGLAYGGNAVEMIPQTHPELIAILKKAGDLLAAPVVGFDFIIPDATIGPTGQRWGIIEANAEPFIDLHHDPLEGMGINVAAMVWDLWT